MPSLYRVLPYFRWAGGKRRLMTTLHQYLPQEFERYFEPFLGSACMYLTLDTDNAVLSDINRELITTYKVIQSSVDELIALLQDMSKHISSEDYYAVRKQDRDPSYQQLGDVPTAARFIYLNRLCFNGLYRVNSRGECNSPYGKIKNPKICDVDHLRALSKCFQDAHVKFLCQSWDKVLPRAQAGDFVYLDPPYHPLSATSSFVSYSLAGWTTANTTSLKTACDELSRRGVKFMLSNSDTQFIWDLFADYRIDRIEVQRSISANAANRGKIHEVVIRNYA